MCTIITYILPGNHSSQEISDSMGSLFTRGVKAFDNPALSGVLQTGEAAWMSREGCDCGTWIGAGSTIEPEESFAEQKIAKLKRKGWSDAKIERALADSKLAAARHNINPEELRADFLEALGQGVMKLQLPYVRLFWHEYSGLLTEEVLQLSELRFADKGSLESTLRELPENVILSISSNHLIR